VENIKNGGKRRLGTGVLSTRRGCEGSTGNRKENTGSLKGHFSSTARLRETLTKRASRMQCEVRGGGNARKRKKKIYCPSGGFQD
jgi:hypothetical protein